MNYTELSAALQSYTENTGADFVNAIPTIVQQAEQRIYNAVQLANLRKNVTGQLTAGNKYLSCPTDFLSVYSIAVFLAPTTMASGNQDANTITVTDPTNIAVGMYATGSGVATGATVTAVSGNTVTLSLPNTQSVNEPVTFQGDYVYLLNRDVNYMREIFPNPQYRSTPKYYAIFGPRSDTEDELTFILGPTPDKQYSAELHYYYYPESIVTAGQTWLGDNFDTVLLYASLVESYIWMKGDQDLMQLYDTKFKEALGLLKNLGDGKQRGDAYQDGQVKQRVV